MNYLPRRKAKLADHVVTALLLVIVPLLGVLALQQWERVTDGRARLSEDSRREAVTLAAELRGVVTGIQNQLQTIAASPLARSKDPVQCDAWLRELQQASHGPAALGIADAKGRVTCLSRRLNTRQLSTADRYYFTEAVRRNEFVTGLFASGKATGANAIHFAFPLRDADGVVEGVAFAPLNLQWLAGRLAEREVPASATVFIADRKGTVLARAPEPHLIGQPLPAALRALMPRSAPGAIRLPKSEQQGPQQVGYVPTGHDDDALFVAVALDEDMALAPIRAATERITFVAVLALIFGVGFAGFLLRARVVAPAQSLAADAQALARGEATSTAAPDFHVAELERLRGALLELDGVARSARRDRVDAEAAVREAMNRAQASSRSLADVIAVAAHDLRQPTQTMVLSAALLGQLLAGRPEQPAAQRLERSSRHLVAMLDSLLSLSQLESGRVQPEIELVAVHALAQSLVEESLLEAQALGVKLVWDGVPAWTRSDQHLLRRLLGNCVSNALKYTRAGGEVRLSTAIVDGCVRLTVQDTGIGIPADQVLRIWHPYYQIDNTERDVTKGLGLGLAIVRRIADLLGHGVELRSSVGTGTAIELRLASVKAPLEVGHTAPAPDRAMQGRLLLVEDDANVAASTADILTAAGVQVTVSPTAEHALAVLEERTDALRFDAVLADHRLPALSGLVVLRAARQRWPGVAAVLMTGGLPAARADECVAEGITVLAKPFAISDLRHALAALEATGPAT